MTDRKPILCMDFDGVIHSYTSPWQSEAIIPDPPVTGAFHWIERALEVFDVHIYSRRSISESGRKAMALWFGRHGGGRLVERLTFAHEKPAAFLTIDDRAVCFQGEWSKLDPRKLREFRPWNRL